MKPFELLWYETFWQNFCLHSVTARVEFIDGAYKIDDGDDEHDEDFDIYMTFVSKGKVVERINQVMKNELHGYSTK